MGVDRRSVRWAHQGTGGSLLPLHENFIDLLPSPDVSLLPGEKDHDIGVSTQTTPPLHPSKEKSTRNRKRKPPKRRGRGRGGKRDKGESSMTTKKGLFGKQLPKYEIHRWYVDHHPEFEFDDQTYQYSTTREKNSTAWMTATFTCPVTQQVYESGTFRTTERWGESKLLHGKVHYRNLTAAVHAAAARAMDEISFREQGVAEPRQCEEDPSKPKGELLWKQLPKWELHNFYRKTQSGFTDDTYQTTKVSDSEDKTVWFWATFTCPVTGKVYEAGSLIESGGKEWGERRVVDGKNVYRTAKSAEHAAASRALDDIAFRETGSLEPRLCEESPEVLSNNVELVSASSVGPENGEVLQQVDEKAVGDAPGESAEMDGLDETAIEDGAQMGTTTTQPAPILRVPASIQLYETTDENEEEYVIRHTASTDVSGVAINERSTLERVIEAWAESVAMPSREITISRGHRQMEESPRQKKQKAIVDAMAWYQQLKCGKKAVAPARSSERSRKFQHNSLPVTVTLAAGTAMLTALANANDLYYEDDMLNRKLEDAATKILRYMWTRSDKPNTATYNAYMGCLSRSDPTSAAQRAEEMLRSMEEELVLNEADPSRGTFPRPDIESYNFVMKLWSHVGGTHGYEKCVDVMNSLEKDKIRGERIIFPSRKSFLTLLSSMANPGMGASSVFQKEHAVKWVERMQAYSVSKSNHAMMPDIQVYNAPLRWSGGIEDVISRPFAHRLPWDAHDRIFQNGFRETAEDEVLAEAEKAQAWLLYIRDDTDVSPDIQTFEAVIQAWVRTGTKHGVKNAENWAVRAIKSGVNVRLQTFHPILAAWAYSGDARAPGKVRYRIDRLEEVSEASSEAMPDGRIYLALVTAWRSYQRRLLEEQAPGAIDAHTNVFKRLEECAESCTDILDGMCEKVAPVSDESQAPFFLDATAFAQAASSWGALALFARSSETQNNEFTNQAVTRAVQKMIDIMRRMDSTIQSMRESHREKTAVSPHNEFEENYAVHDLQLRHMITYAYLTHLEVLTYFNSIDASRSSADEPSFFVDLLPEVELMLRRSEEYRRLSYRPLPTGDAGDGFLQDSTTAVYTDLYTYHPRVTGSDMSYTEAQAALFSAIVEGCQSNLNRSFEYSGDIVRLCSLMRDFMLRKGAVHLGDGTKRQIRALSSIITSIRKKSGDESESSSGGDSARDAKVSTWRRDAKSGRVPKRVVKRRRVRHVVN